MLYSTLTINDKDYKLRLTTRNIISLEKELGYNPIFIFGDGDTVPTVTVMVTILFYSLQAYNHGITKEEAYNIFDEYLAEGKTITDFIYVILDVYRVSGIISENPEGETEKN